MGNRVLVPRHFKTGKEILIEGDLNTRWLGRVGYGEAWDLQKSMNLADMNHLLLLEHPPVYTFGKRGERSHLLVEPEEVGAEEYWVERGGDVTFHGPGQLVGYPILSPILNWGSSSNGNGRESGNGRNNRTGGGLLLTAKYVRELEDLLIEVLDKLGVKGAYSQKKYPGVWIEGATKAAPSKKIASIGIRLARGRTMHGFGLNVSTDLSWFEHIIPCGIPGIQMTSIANELSKDSKERDLSARDLSVKEVAELVAEVAARRWSKKPIGQTIGQTIGPAIGLDAATDTSVGAPTNTGIPINARKPEWLRAPVKYSQNYSRLKLVLKDLPTVCESAGCPNLFECWGEGTATFMINGDRCTRNCGFCLVDTQKPLALDATEPERLAEAVKKMRLQYVVITAVARDDLKDGGAGGFVEAIKAVRDIAEKEGKNIGVEVLIPDFKGRPDLLDLVIREEPEVLNHNIETVLRLQKRVRPQAGYARSLAVLARAKAAGLTTKSSIMVGLGETMEEVKETLVDLSAVGTDIVTIGQYLRPSARHLPVSRWWAPEEFQELAEMQNELNIAHIEAGPLVRSSYKAKTSYTASTPKSVTLKTTQNTKSNKQPAEIT